MYLTFMMQSIMILKRKNIKRATTMKKYELTENTITFLGNTLYQIRSLIDFDTIKVGDLGGYIQSETNLSHIT